MKLRGTLIDDRSGQPLAHARVAVGSRITQTGPDGSFALDVEKVGPHRRLSITAGEHVYEVVKEPKDWRETPSDVPLDIVVRPVAPDRVVHGTVRHTSGAAVSDVVVRAAHIAIGGEQVLGEAKPDQTGTYAIRYKRSGAGADLVVRALNDQKQVVATSAVVYVAGSDESVDLIVTDARHAGPSEYEQLHAAVHPEVGNSDPSTLDAEDVALLADKLGLSRARVVRYVAAHRMAAVAHVPPEAAYGLLRLGASPAVAGRQRIQTDDISRRLSAAADTNIVSRVAASGATKVVSALRAALLRGASDREGDTAGAVLQAAGVPKDKAEDLLRRYADHEGDLPAFWSALAGDPAWGREALERARFACQIGQLTFGHVPVVGALVARGIKTGRGTAELTRSEWRTLLDGLGDRAVPPSIPGETAEKRKDHYAELLVQRAELAFPTAAVAAAMRRAKLPAERDALRFLDANPGFDFATSSISVTLADPKTVLDGISDRAALATQLGTFQRLFKITPELGKHRSISLLAADKLTSSLAVQRSSRSQFIERYGKRLGVEAAAETYGRAVAHSATALHVMLANGAAFQGPEVASVQRVSNASQQAMLRVPDYRTLFGSIDFCECIDCRSVLSPAAYFVDLLAWLDTAAPGSVDLLLQRRADLGRLELSCENTNTLLPYVDLVNEVLENAIAKIQHDAGVPGFRRIPHDATTKTASELLAAPEYENTAVYDQILAWAVYPFDLPFDRAASEARVYLRQIGIDRWSLMETFQREPDEPTNLEIAAEYLELSSAQRALIVGTDARMQWELWGYKAQAGLRDPRGGAGTVGWRKALQYLPELLRRSGLEYVELLDVLHSDFVNPDRKLGLSTPEGDACDLSKLELERADDGASDGIVDAPTADDFDRIRRFVRLWRALEVSILDLDKILTALNGQLVDRTVGQVAEVLRLQAATGGELLDLLSWFGPLDTKPDREGKDAPTPSLYERRFLDHTIGGDAAGWPFALDATGAVAVPHRFADASAQLQAVLQLDARDLAAAIEWAADETGRTVDTLELDLEALGWCYRIASLAKTLGLSVADALAYRALVGIDPFSGPANARKLVEMVGESVTTRFSIGEVRYLLAHQSSELGPPEEQLAVVLGGIRSALGALIDADLDARKAVVADKIATALGVELAIAVDLLQRVSWGGEPTLRIFTADGFVGGQPFTPGEEATNGVDKDLNPVDQPAAFAALTLLLKIGTILTRLEITPGEQAWLFEHHAILGIPDLGALPVSAGAPAQPFAKWRSLMQLVAGRDRIPGTSPSFVELFDPLLAVDATEAAEVAALDSFAQALAKRTTWQVEDIASAIAATLGDGRPRELARGGRLQRLLDQIAMGIKSGLSTAQLDRWRLARPTSADADEITLAVKARYGESGWTDVARSLRDELREQQRRSLVAWLVHDLNLTSSSDLFERYLIDVEMSPVGLTSRLVQAISSVQLFIQRCFLSLEAGVELDPALDDRWTWMRNYRVWEANRKVFLYPENWIEPELRLDRTPLFRQFESALLQDEIDDERVESAYLAYLQGLAEIARLDVAGLYHDPDTGVLHVVGRTRGIARTYYYRTRDEGRWTAWTKVEADIEGDHVIPIVHDRRLMLFWPVFREATVPGTVKYEHWTVQLAWTELWDGAWTPKVISTESLATPYSLPRVSRETFLFRTRIESGQLVIALLQDDPADNREDLQISNNERTCIELGTFRPNPCDRTVRVEETMTSKELTMPSATYIDAMNLAAKYWYSLSLTAGSPPADVLVFLDRANAGLEITPPHQHEDFASQDVFFISDVKHTLFVEPSLRASIDPRAGIVSPAVFTSVKPDVPVWKPGTGISFKGGLAGLRASSALLSELAYKSPKLEITARYAVSAFEHPYVCNLVAAVRRDGVDGMLAPPESDPLSRQRMTNPYFVGEYGPTSAVLQEYPQDEFDFEPTGAYAQYNWELFLHAPLLVAERLRTNQRFEEAERWYRFLFDPTCHDTIDAPARYWRIQPLAQPVDGPIETLVSLLGTTPTDPEALAVQARVRAQIAAWLDDPFDPHAVAMLRPGAYQKSVVMKYLDNLIEWADHLFRQDSMESINQATQLYLLALSILGARPQVIPPRTKVANASFNELRPVLDELSNALVAVENILHAPTRPLDGDGPPLGSVTYFCVPRNEMLCSYWDTIDDRLFKIRHGMNIEGVVRQLALFQPPIDPALLVRAAAMGVDLSSAISDLQAPLPSYRFVAIMAKAQAFCATVRGLGNALLSALEKRDAEEISQLRQTQEVGLLEAARGVRQLQVDEAKQQLSALERTQAMVQGRRDYYQELCDNDLLPSEKTQREKTKKAANWQLAASIADATAGVLHALPNIEAGTGFFTESGGAFWGAAAGSVAAMLRAESNWKATGAQLAGMTASNQRRRAEWEQQRAQASLELTQLEKQLAAAQLRVTIAERELANHDRQVTNARDVDTWMRAKYTNRDLYDWMVGQLSSLYFQSYQLAYDLAKRAEQCFRFELADTDATFVQFGHWDSLKKGLLAGDRLQYDLERCEAAYLEGDEREYEITRHVSLAALDPVALVQLREHGTCSFALPEAVFDVDFPGHYLRRIKSLAVTVPCVTGPYTGVNCTLTLTSSSVRHDPDASSPYPRTGASDTRFRDETLATSIVTSVGQSDAGLFEVSSQDPRYLPFERRGVIGAWTLTLAPALRQIDPQTISDVVLHVRYTAREGGAGLAAKVRETLAQQLTDTGLSRAISGRHELPDAWYAFLHPTGTTAQALDVDLTIDRFPLAFRDRGITISQIDLYGVLASSTGFDGARLKLDVSSLEPDGTVKSVGEDVVLETVDGQPQARIVPSGALGPTRLRFAVDAGSTGEYVDPSTSRLRRDVLRDLVVVARFSIS